MMKFFRKYNKQLLALFMVMLMIVFIAGDAFQYIVGPRTDVSVVETRFGPITRSDQSIAENSTRILSTIGFDWTRPVAGMKKPLEPIDWILLNRETADLGVSVSPEALTSIGGLFANTEAIDDLARRLRIRPDQVRNAFGQLIAVQDAAKLIGDSVAPSEAQIRHAAHSALQKIKIEAVVLPAKGFVDDQAPVSEDELQAHFAKYRDKPRGEGVEFGYFMPETVKVQFVRIDRDAIKARIGVPNLEKKAKDYFNANREKTAAFRRPPEPPPVPKEGESETPEPEPQKAPFLEWDEAAEKAKDMVKQQHADEAAARIADWLVENAGEYWVDIDRGLNGYKTAPAVATSLGHYDDLIKLIPEAIAFPEAVQTGATDYFTAADAKSVLPLGLAVNQTGGGLRRIGRLAFQTEGVVPSLTGKEGIDFGEFTATYQTSPFPLTDPNGNVYAFRVIDVRQPHAAASLGEVREKAIEDLRLSKGYETAKVHAQALAKDAAAKGLNDAYLADSHLKNFEEQKSEFGGGFVAPPPFPRMTTSEAIKGRYPAGRFIASVLGQLPNDVIDDAFRLADTTDKTAVHELKNRATVLVIKWLENIPAREDEFAKVRDDLIQKMTEDRAQLAKAEWAAPENIRARNGFTLVGAK